MSLTAPKLINSNLSRKSTIGSEIHLPNIRPIVKGAYKEAANTLTEAYIKDNIMGWCVQGLEQKKHEEFLHTLFEHIIYASSTQNREFALQVDGCKGVLIWTNKGSSPWPRVFSTMKLARLIGWSSALRAVTKVGPSCDKLKRKMMAQHPKFITICHVGVLSHENRKGYGSSLVSHVLKKADEANYPVYVEVSDPDGVKFFEQFGFEVKATVFIANRHDLPVALMVRLPMA
ncbi:hypothetical protein EDC96DRAFT_493391 [Choanephora cucurbitarum]|nr:hypothetical protein EDC96DRAFT_493391 [Choanephora cucurbitarum]